jgi:hypothetical protein
MLFALVFLGSYECETAKTYTPRAITGRSPYVLAPFLRIAFSKASLLSLLLAVCLEDDIVLILSKIIAKR